MDENSLQKVQRMAAEHGYRVVSHGELCDLIPLERRLLPRHDASLKDVLEYFLHPVNERGLQAAWKGLNLERFEVVGCFGNLLHPVLLLHDTEPTPLRWCVQYAGSGQYFRDFESAAAYTITRFGAKRFPQKNIPPSWRRTDGTVKAAFLCGSFCKNFPRDRVCAVTHILSRGEAAFNDR